MESTTDTPAPPAPGKPSLKQRFKTLIAESGAIVLWVYFGIFGLVLVSTATALEMGVKLDGVAGAAGIWGAAYLFTKLTQPLRIAATCAPIAGRRHDDRTHVRSGLRRRPRARTAP